MASIKRPTQNKWMSGFVYMSADQTANLSAPNHLEFDSASGDFVVSTGAGQANGLITLPGGHKYRINCVYIVKATTGNFTTLNVEFYDTTNAASLVASQAIKAANQSTNHTTTFSVQQFAFAEFYVTDTIQLEVQITGGGTSIDYVSADFTAVIIQEIPK